MSLTEQERRKLAKLAGWREGQRCDGRNCHRPLEFDHLNAHLDNNGELDFQPVYRHPDHDIPMPDFSDPRVICGLFDKLSSVDKYLVQDDLSWVHWEDGGGDPPLVLALAKAIASVVEE